MTKLCKDCKHSIERNIGFECSNTKHPMKTDNSTGTTSLRWSWCSILREDGWFWSLMLHTCGKRGRWFEAKDDT